MKIAIMTTWNTEDGASIHSKALVTQWQKMGHKVTVFSFVKKKDGSESFTDEDGREIIRCFDNDRIDPIPILNTEHDVFVVEDLRTLPITELSKIFPMISSRSRTVHIVHEQSLPERTWFYQLLWDKVIYYDVNQVFLKDIYPDAEYVPFPCFPLRTGDKQKYRTRLHLPQEKKIIFVFCQRGYEPYITSLPERVRDKAVLLFVTPKGYDLTSKLAEKENTIIREEGTLTIDKFDEYLFASDAVVLHKMKNRYHNIISGLIFQLIGAGCPILIPQISEFFRHLEDEIIYYGDIEDLNNKICELLEHEQPEVLEKAEVFVRMNDSEKIAQLYIDLFTRILRKR